MAECTVNRNSGNTWNSKSKKNRLATSRTAADAARHKRKNVQHGEQPIGSYRRTTPIERATYLAGIFFGGTQKPPPTMELTLDRGLTVGTGRHANLIRPTANQKADGHVAGVFPILQKHGRQQRSSFFAVSAGSRQETRKTRETKHKEREKDWVL